MNTEKLLDIAFIAVPCLFVGFHLMWLAAQASNGRVQKLFSGKVLLTRQENPYKFWMHIGSQAAHAVLVLGVVLWVVLNFKPAPPIPPAAAGQSAPVSTGSAEM
ncbi:hypothetical protein DB346_18785 [Verrucomicrobia bacterium LW23]|nr:hypothetical protein DB346_18785 [Verrucomicrobia bacterium LW23]